MEKIVEIVAAEHNIAKTAAKELVKSVLDAIVKVTSEEGKVSFIGFGTFTKVNKAARNSFNPREKKLVEVPATTLPKFKAGTKFKEAVKA